MLTPMTEDRAPYRVRRLSSELLMQQLFQELGWRRDEVARHAAATHAEAKASLPNRRTQLQAEYLHARLELRIIASAQKHLFAAWTALRRLRSMEVASVEIQVDPDRTRDVIAQLGSVVRYRGDAWLVQRIRAVEQPTRKTLVGLRRESPTPDEPLEELAGDPAEP